MKHKLYVKNQNAKHTYQIDIKATQIIQIEVEADSLKEAREKAEERFNNSHGGFDWYTFGHCHKES